MEKESKFEEVKTQMEYYLSDENLKRDNFFHEKISTDPNGYIDLDLFLKCNKIIKAKWSKEDLISGIKLSSVIELDAKSSRVRRKDNPPLPDLTMLQKKRKKQDDDNEDKDKPKVDINAEPTILLVSSPKDVATKWKDVIAAFKNENPLLNVIYGRFKGNEGHIGVIPSSEEEPKFNPTFEVDDSTFSVKKCVEESLIDFWKNHGSHFELCAKANKDPKGQKKKKKGNVTFLDTSVQLGGQSYSDISMIRAKARSILTNSKDNEPLNENDNKFITDILKYHHNYDDKVKSMDYISTGTPEKYESSRCYIIVNKDKTKSDFSIQKCIENLEAKHKK